MSGRRRPRRTSVAAVAVALAGAGLALAGCTTAFDRYRTLPVSDRAEYERCAMERCGPAPQWRGEALWATQTYERERDAHIACWDAPLEGYVAIQTSEQRRIWLLSRCRRQLTLPRTNLLPLGPRQGP